MQTSPTPLKFVNSQRTIFYDVMLNVPLTLLNAPPILFEN
jgi:hypothetical protein